MKSAKIIMKQALAVAGWLNAVEKVDITRVTYNFAGEVFKRWASELEGFPQRRACPKSNFFNERLASFRDRNKHLFAKNLFEEVTQSKSFSYYIFLMHYFYDAFFYVYVSHSIHISVFFLLVPVRCTNKCWQLFLLKPCSHNEDNVDDENLNFTNSTIVAVDVNAWQVDDVPPNLGYLKKSRKANQTSCLVLGLAGDPVTVVRNMATLAFDAVQLHKYGVESRGCFKNETFNAMAMAQRGTLSAILRSFKFGHRPMTIIEPRFALAVSRLANCDAGIRVSQENVAFYVKLQSSTYSVNLSI